MRRALGARWLRSLVLAATVVAFNGLGVAAAADKKPPFGTLPGLPGPGTLPGLPGVGPGGNSGNSGGVTLQKGKGGKKKGTAKVGGGAGRGPGGITLPSGNGVIVIVIKPGSTPGSRSGVLPSTGGAGGAVPRLPAGK
jgi:hypothetical protein